MLRFALLVLAVLAVLAVGAAPASAEDGSDLWLRYEKVDDRSRLEQYRRSVTGVVVENVHANQVHRHTADLRMEPGSSEKLVGSTLEAARDELVRGLGGLLGRRVPVRNRAVGGAVVVGTPESSKLVRRHVRISHLGDEGYVIRSVKGMTVIAGRTELGALYGTFAFLRRMQTGQRIKGLDIASSPRVENRHLNNWETVRLYAGDAPVFNFASATERNLPVVLDRYIVVARALASVGINGFEINLVNADNVYLTPAYIAQEAALADALRPYGIKLSLAINYTAPTDQRFAPDTLTNEQLDPYSDAFRSWWNRKARELQASIPDFMGFTVKANSEGQPGPQDFGYDHGDGANGIAAAVAPLGMSVYWRTFVYNADVDPDRLKRAYMEFGPIDDEDRFLDNVFLQTKNGPLDFQAREPVHPMFGRMENTNQALELQITQEYTGQSTMLAYLGPMWEEVLKTETHAPGRVGEIVDGSAQGHEDSAIVGVANLGNADNLTGHHFSQANLFAFGRQAWDWKLDSDDIAEDWVRMTWSNDERVVDAIVELMMGSWEALVSYQTPLGIGHQFRSSDHYGPKPDEFFIKDDWSPVYYNQADGEGLGYDRSPTGSNFTAQYFPPLERRYGSLETVPENLMMWFHHVPWDHRMRNGRSFWDELVLRYQTGVQYVTWMRETWDRLEPYIDARRFAEVQAKLAQHEIDAADWRDTSVGYWQTFSERPIPVDGPLAVEVVAGGKRYGPFDASAASYEIPGPIATVRVKRGARYRILEQSADRAVVQVRGRSFFGPIVKNYVFEISSR
jgi:alpha-glucuronidase